MSVDPPGFVRLRILLYSAAGNVVVQSSSGTDASGSPLVSQWSVKLPEAITDVVWADLISMSNAGYAVTVAPVPSDSQMAGTGAHYWRWASALSMRRTPLPDSAHLPARFTLDTLTVNFYNPDGSAAYLGPTALEIEVVQRR
jgi:hypothetical protein